MKTSRGTRWLRGTLVTSTFVVLFLVATLSAPIARAVPSFTRQTGFACSSCHTTPPELTPLGRSFKLNGYTMAGMPTTKVKQKGTESGLSLLQVLPLSVFFDAAFTSTKKPQQGTQNGSFQFPEDVSLFLAGEWSTHVGSFVQITYDTQDDHFTWDNTDIRYANSTKLMSKELVYGITLNNSPTVEDLWHSTPAWGFPWVNDDFAPKPTAAALANLSLAQDVAGLGAYGMWNNHLYLAGTMYRSNHVGAPQPFTGEGSAINIHGIAPYWRVAWEQSTTNNYLEVGTYGMSLKSAPFNVIGTHDSYTDWAVDFQYDRTIPRLHNDILSIRGSYIRENAALNATFNGGEGGASQIAHHLNTVQANAEYHFGNRYTATFGWFNTTGTADPVLYNQGCDGPCPITGSFTGSPRSNGYIANVSWWPVQNIDLAAQYTGYLNFNGRSTNYDGSGRNASDNNTVYLVARFVF
jgi:hypothetical protein